MVHRTMPARGRYGGGEKNTKKIQYATDVKNLLFLARLEFLCKTGCVPHYFQYKKGRSRLFPPKSQSQTLNYQILNICLVL